MKATQQKLLVKIFKALSNPHRLELYQKIREAHELSLEAGQGKGLDPENDPCFLNKLMANIGVCASTLSHHLKELINAELIHTKKQGKYLLCRPNMETLNLLKDFVVVAPPREAKTMSHKFDAENQ